MRNVIFRVMPTVALQIYNLNGLMVPTKAGQTISLDDKDSFLLDMQSATTSISSKDLTALVNGYILPRAGTPLRNLSMVLNPDQTISVKGTFHKVIDVPFTSTATMSVTPDGNMQMHLSDMKVGGIIDQSVMDCLGLKVSQFAQPTRKQSFQVVGNDIIFPISQMFPPPSVTGKLKSLSIKDGNLNLVFGATPGTSFAPANSAESYIFFRGGTMRFGRLTMTPVEMELVNLKPAKTFEFALAKYFQQLTAGNSKSLSNGGLLVYMASYQDLPKTSTQSKK